MRPIIIINSDIKWERQFILKELLPNLSIIECNSYEICNTDFYKNINNLINNNIFIFTSSKNYYHDVLNIVAYLKPIMIINLSDEYGTKKHYQELAKRTKYLFRQYHHPSYPHYNNIGYIPLGYMNNMLEPNYHDIELLPPSKRNYIWSFVGHIKKDRIKMITIFSNIKPFCLKTTDVIDMRNIYRNSIFVPNGRGFHSLDCLRLYEASICGAIPVIVGPEKEYKETFKYEENPPWIFADNWDNALAICKNLLNDMEELDILHKKVVLWWRIRVFNVKNKINEILEI